MDLALRHDFLIEFPLITGPSKLINGPLGDG
jgi:hypothetical protein